MSGIAVVAASDPPPIPVSDFSNTPILALTVSEPGAYAVFARIVLFNADGDSQNASVRLYHQRDEQDRLDWVDLRIPGDTSLAISLQGTLRVSEGDVEVVMLSCSTFNGAAARPWITAIQVDDLKLF